MRGRGRARARARAVARSPASRRRAAPVSAPACGSRCQQPRLRHQHRRAGVRQHERQPLRRVVRVERQVGAAGLQDAQQPDHHLRRALHAQPHHRLRTHPQAAQVMRQAVGVRIQRRVAQPPLPEHHRHRRPACAQPAPQTAPAASPPATGRAVSFQPSSRCARARRPTGCSSDRRPRAPDRPPPPPAAAPAARPTPQRCPGRTGRPDSPAAAAAARPAAPSGSADNASHRGRAPAPAAARRSRRRPAAAPSTG